MTALQFFLIHDYEYKYVIFKYKFGSAVYILVAILIGV